MTEPKKMFDEAKFWQLINEWVRTIYVKDVQIPLDGMDNIDDFIDNEILKAKREGALEAIRDAETEMKTIFSALKEEIENG